MIDPTDAGAYAWPAEFNADTVIAALCAVPRDSAGRIALSTAITYVRRLSNEPIRVPRQLPRLEEISDARNHS